MGSELDQGMGSLQTQLDADIGSMILDRAGTDSEFVGNFFARFILGQQQKYLSLGRGQVIERRGHILEIIGAAAAIEQVCGKRRADVTLTGGFPSCNLFNPASSVPIQRSPR